MTKDQLEKLKSFITETAKYEAARITDDEASYRNLRQAERDLDTAFENDASVKQ